MPVPADVRVADDLPASIQEAAYNALAQTHPIKVYVVQGSYMDGRLAEMMGPENFEKLYQ